MERAERHGLGMNSPPEAVCIFALSAPALPSRIKSTLASVMIVGLAGPPDPPASRNEKGKAMHSHGRPSKLAAFISMLAVIVACGGDTNVTGPGTTTPPELRLKDVVIDRLPSPFYHFEYDASGRIASVSYASGMDVFGVTYIGAKIKELTNSGGIGNRDRIVYAYDDAGRVGGVRYVDTNGITTTVNIYTYDGGKLAGVERSRRVPGGLIIDKTMAFTYYADGNLETITEHRPPIQDLQTDATSVTRFEEYDAGSNVDGFSLIHDDFFDHLVLLPGVQLQKNNPRRETRTGDGVTYSVTYTYGYDTDGKRPLTKVGDLLITGGTDAGARVQTSSVFTF
jgi:hypothetical protein